MQEGGVSVREQQRASSCSQESVSSLLNRNASVELLSVYFWSSAQHSAAETTHQDVFDAVSRHAKAAEGNSCRDPRLTACERYGAMTSEDGVQLQNQYWDDPESRD